MVVYLMMMNLSFKHRIYSLLIFTEFCFRSQSFSIFSRIDNIFQFLLEDVLLVVEVWQMIYLLKILTSHYNACMWKNNKKCFISQELLQLINFIDNAKMKICTLPTKHIQIIYQTTACLLNYFYPFKILAISHPKGQVWWSLSHYK